MNTPIKSQHQVLRDVASKSEDLLETPGMQTSTRETQVLQRGKDQGEERIWRRPTVPRSLRDPLGTTNKLANEELSRVLAPPAKETKQHIDLLLSFDLRNNARARFWARIRDSEGIILAEVWGTKSGKARTYRIGRDRVLDPSVEHQVKLAIPVARQFVTGRKEAASADDSAPDSGSDTSDDES